ncbi:MAG: hypothetical protein JWP25_14 [Bradyrhizobium sp.]|nr:hypothetical protein [Bradyrhizobium sp.]
MDSGAKTVAGPRHSHVRQSRVCQARAEQLGNTPAVCRKSYIHPRSLAAILIRLVQSNAGDDRGEHPRARTVEGVVMRLPAEWTAADKRSPPRSRSGSRRVRGQTDSGLRASKA